MATGNIHIGTSGWSYDHWKKLFYPHNIGGGQMLGYYSSQFNTVEINSTFYRLPSIETIPNWKSAVPKGFRFAVKGSRYITHQKKLNDPVQSVEKFFNRIKGLDDKLGPILFQLPPRWHKNRDRLSEFVNALPTAYRYAFEFRDPSWFDDAILSLIEENKAGFCIYDLEDRETPLYVTTDFVYIRLHGPGAKYEGRYSERLLEPWVGRIKNWIKDGKEIYCYFNNDLGGHAPRDARRLLEMSSAIKEGL